MLVAPVKEARKQLSLKDKMVLDSAFWALGTISSSRCRLTNQQAISRMGVIHQLHSTLGVY